MTKLKSMYQSLQDTLASVNKILSNEKKIIKEEHDSQVDDGKMVKVARRILQHQKMLVALFKVHKQLGAKIKSIDQK